MLNLMDPNLLFIELAVAVLLVVSVILTVKYQLRKRKERYERDDGSRNEAANAIESLKAEVLRLTVALSETEALEMSHGERIENLYGHIAELYVGYVRLMENGRDRIMMLGGDCDSVDFMEANDPLLINIRNVMKK